MKRRKLNALLCGLALGVSIWLPGQVSAEVRTVEADGVYQMGDGMAENQSIAKERAKAEAVRSAGEQAAAYVESDTVVSNGKVTKDDIRLMAAAVLELKDVKYTPVIVGESVQFKCHVVAVVDTDKVQEKIQEDNLTLKASLKQYEAENDRLRQEMEQLKQESQSSHSKESVREKIKENDRKFEANESIRQVAYCVMNKKYTQAIEYAEKALKQNPQDAFIYYFLIGGTYAENGDTKKSIDYMEKAIILSSAKDISYGDKDDLLLRKMYGAVINGFKLVGKDDKSVYYTKKYIEYLENMMNSNSPQFNDYLDLGEVYCDLGDYKKAIGYLEKAVSMEQQNTIAYDILGRCYRKTGELSKAIDCYKKMLSINQNDYKGYYNLGNVYHDLGEYKNAIAYYEIGITINPEYTPSYIALGMSYVNSSEYNMAIKYFEKATNADQIYYRAMAYALMGLAYEGLGDFKKSNECYKKAESLSPEVKKQIFS